MFIKGAKKGRQQPRTPIIAKDTASSVAYAKILYGLSEGEIAGLADGGKSIFLNDTPIINDNGAPNFTDSAGNGIDYQFRTGTNEQEHITGFGGVENETAVNVIVKANRPFVKSFNNSQLSAVRVRLSWSALRTQNATNGDVTGALVLYAIDVQTDDGAFVTVLDTRVMDKTSAGYERAHRIDLPKGSRWTIRVRRISPDSTSDLVSDEMAVSAVTEIIDAKLRYPNTAMLALRYDAKTFGSIAKLAVRLKGKIINVPSNYNADTREYKGLWDGTFKQAYSNNPAWVFYDICTQWRYGLGDRLDKAMIDKWSLYALGQYCDELVDDGKGGTEPRFSVNVYLQSSVDAFSVLQSLSSLFRAMSFWQGEQIVLDADMPKDAVFTFGAANVVDGVFNYTGTRAKDRHTVAKVAWDNPDNRFKTEYEFVKDEQAIAKLGIKMLELNMMGCTSQGQAQRAGLWALLSEQLQTRTVTFKTGLDGFIPQVGQVINIADNLLAGRAISGRITAVEGLNVTLDRMAGKVGDTLIVNNDKGGLSQAVIVASQGELITTDAVLTDISADNVWAIHSDDLVTMPFRVLSVHQDSDSTFTITALQYNEKKFHATDFGARLTKAPISVIEPSVLPAPSFIHIASSQRVEQGLLITSLDIAWEQVKGAVSYDVMWRKDGDRWQQLPKQSGNSVQIDGVYGGQYLVKVTPINAFDEAGATATSNPTTITDKAGKPPRLSFLKVQGVLFGMSLSWGFANGTDDTSYTEIEQSPNGKSDMVTLAQFAYPTDKHEITGLQGNLVQFYRGRIVDKLGNKSDWSDWTKGVTDANADKVLGLLNGQITSSQLHQDLAMPIGRIDELGLGLTQVKAHINETIKDVGILKQQDDSQRQTLSELKATQNNLSASINAINTAIARGDEALSQQINKLSAVQGQQSGAINEIKQTLVNSEQATSTQINRLSSDLQAKTDWQIIGRKLDLNTIKDNVNYYIKAGENINAPVGFWGFLTTTKVEDKVTQTFWADNDPNLKYTRIFFNNSWSKWQKMATTADIDGVNASINDIRQTQATQNTATASQINTLQTRLSGQQASVQTLQSSVNGLSAQWTLKVQSGGVVSGIGLASNNGVSDFAVRADKFYIASPTGQKGDTPFVVLTRPQMMNGVQVPAGVYLKNAYIAQGSIGAAHIKDGSIDTAKIKNAAVDTLQIAGNAVIVPRALRFDDKRLSYEGEVFLATIESQNAPVVIQSHFFVSGANSKTTTVPGRDHNGSYAQVTLSVQLYVDVYCNNNKIHTETHYLRGSNESYSSFRTVTARAYDSGVMGVYNYLHINPPSTATYAIRIRREPGGIGVHTIHNGSLLLMAVKR